MAIELFNVAYRPGILDAPVTLLCQAVDVQGEKFLWIDGINSDMPLMMPIAAARHIEWAGSFGEFMAARLDLAEQVILASQGEHSPTILARAMLYMSRDASLSGPDAIELAQDQALDIIDSDNMCAIHFDDAMKADAASPA